MTSQITSSSALDIGSMSDITNLSVNGSSSRAASSNSQQNALTLATRGLFLVSGSLEMGVIEISEDDIQPPTALEGQDPTKKTDYYAQGSKELATETPVTVRKLEHVRILLIFCVSWVSL